jgi:hypothetical protein
MLTSVDEAVHVSQLKPAAADPLPTLQVKVGPPVAGFKRTPQLVAHIHQLHLGSAGVDYVLGTSTEWPCPVYLMFPPVRARFQVARDKAMVEGERGTMLVEMCHFVLWYFCAKGKGDLEGRLGPIGWAKSGVGRAVRDMEKEYAFKEGELEVQLKEMEERWRADEQKRL